MKFIFFLNLFVLLSLGHAIPDFPNEVVNGYESMITWKSTAFELSKDEWLAEDEAHYIKFKDVDQSEWNGRMMSEATEDPLQDVGDEMKAVLGVLKLGEKGLKDFLEVVKQGKRLMNVLGIEPTNDVILFDRLCGNCDLWIKCFTDKKTFDWVPVEEDEGAILRFRTKIPHNWTPLSWAGKWRCRFKDTVTGREVEGDVFGGSAPKRNEILLRVKAKKISGIDVDSGRADFHFANIMW